MFYSVLDVLRYSFSSGIINIFSLGAPNRWRDGVKTFYNIINVYHIAFYNKLGLRKHDYRPTMSHDSIVEDLQL